MALDAQRTGLGGLEKSRQGAQAVVACTDPMGVLPNARDVVQVLLLAITQRQTIWEYAPKSRAAEDYDVFVGFVRDRDVHGTRTTERDAQVEKAQTNL